MEALHDASARDAVRGILAAAPARGIPVEPLLTKVREGIAKRSTPERIRDAVSALASRLETAATGVRPVHSVDELAAAAGALQAGVPVGTLREMRKTWTGRPLTVPLGVVTELVVNGAPASEAGKRVRELMRAGATPAQLVAMGGAVRADVAAGLAPGHSLALRSKGVLSLLGAPPLSTTIQSPIRPDRPPQ